MSDLATAMHAAARAVEQGDPDRFAATMATPADLRDRLWPLYAANLEIARAPWASSEPMVAEMRLQWWIDALEGVGEGRVPPHEIGAALMPLAGPARHLVSVAEARRADCWPDPFEGPAALWAYLDQTSGGLYWAAAEALGAPPEAEPATRSFGAGAGLAALLRAWPELVARARAPMHDPAPELLRELAREGLVRLTAGRRKGALAGTARLALLPGWQARGQLSRVLERPERVLEGGLEPSEFSRRAGLLRAGFFGI
ncbi:phytoene synthase [Thioclava sp. BHET1]|nr:phytoene synthase [Thioclava sp. BHET1]